MTIAHLRALQYNDSYCFEHNKKDRDDTRCMLQPGNRRNTYIYKRDVCVRNHSIHQVFFEGYRQKIDNKYNEIG